MPLRIPIGIDDFRTLREGGLEYVDKTSLIQELLDRSGVQVVLLPRPRRFGKTLNLSMLRCWFEKRDEDLSHLFQDLAIWQAGAETRAHFQRYPVIHFNFKGSKASTFEACWAVIREKIIDVFIEHRYLLESGRLDEIQAQRFRQILDGTADRGLYERALLDMSAHLHAHHGEKVVILIDEYDEPIHAGYFHGFAQTIIDFMRNFLGAALKSNSHLYKAVITGILRVAKENLFSGLNNPGVYTLLRPELHTCFGFTEAEVAALLERCGRANKLKDVRTWYNGYLFGGEVIYNPWSILCFLDSSDAEMRPYWLQTSSNDLVRRPPLGGRSPVSGGGAPLRGAESVAERTPSSTFRELLERYALKLQPVFEVLLEGGSLERVVDENVALNEIRSNEDALWSLLLFSGYLKAEKVFRGEGEQSSHRLSIPNLEVRQVYATTFRTWMKARVEGSGGSLEDMIDALLGGDAEVFEQELQSFVTNLLSYHDPGRLRPERVYHGFVVGLLAALEPAYQVRSNRESGKGRPDVTVRPMSPGKPGVVLELKVARQGKRTLEEALAEGLSQIATRDYGAELRAAGAAPIHAMAVAFDGKEVRVRAAPDETRTKS